MFNRTYYTSFGNLSGDCYILHCRCNNWFHFNILGRSHGVDYYVKYKVMLGFDFSCLQHILMVMISGTQHDFIKLTTKTNWAMGIREGVILINEFLDYFLGRMVKRTCRSSVKWILKVVKMGQGFSLVVAGHEFIVGFSLEIY